MRAGVRSETPVVLWALALALLALGPALGSGFVLVRDMVWVPDLALRPDFLGLGSGLPRAVPSDAVVAVLDELVPGMVLQKLVLVLALAAGGVGAARLLGPSRLAVRLCAVTVYGWNALVAERLLMGHWPVLVGYAVLPWLIGAASSWRVQGRLPVRLLVLVPLGCLSASAGLASALVVLAFGAGRGRTVRATLLVAAGNAPWLVSGLLHASSATSDAAGAEVFALHGEGSVPGPLAALTLGGIWNSETVPDSRTGVLGWLVLVVLVGLAALGARPWVRRTGSRDRAAYVACWGAGWGLATLSWAAPGAVGWLAAHVPGAGVARDGSRLLVLCAPLLVVLVAEGVRSIIERAPQDAVARVALGLAAVLVPVALMPDLAWGAGGELRPATYPEAYAAARGTVSRALDHGWGESRGDVLALPDSSYRQPSWNHGQKVLDPVGRYLTRDYVASDVLLVDGVPLAGEDPRAREATRALALPTPQARAAALARLGIGAVVIDRTAPGSSPEVAGSTLLDGPVLRVVVLDGVRVREVPSGWMVAMAVAWTMFLSGFLSGVLAAAVRAVGAARKRSRHS